MFEGLGERLQKIVHKAKGYGKINEDNHRTFVPGSAESVRRPGKYPMHEEALWMAWNRGRGKGISTDR